MSFVRKKIVNGRAYFQLVENVSKDGKAKQKVVRHLGTEENAIEYCRKHGIQFPSQQKETRTSGFFDSTKQTAEFLTALRGRKEIPLKFEYLRKGAENWKKTVESKTYGLGKMENELIQENAKRIVQDVGKANIVDIGCGTGEKAFPFIQEMKRLARPKYIAFDISPEMIALAKTNLEKRFPKLNTRFVVADFEQSNLAEEMESIREKNFKKSLFLFLGNTVGNVSDKSRVLANLRDSMTLEDNLLVGIELFDLGRISKIFDHYRNSPEAKVAMLNTLNYFGVSEHDGKFVVSFNREKSQAEAHFVMKRACKLKLGSRQILLRKGDNILVMTSYKATPKQLQILLADSGFVILQLYLSPQEDYALILCKPAKF
ncbi:MAG: L-histidine N(alpha)-methyltransferase [Candidatus Diapherotrites archaeon]